ncbi:hypothetical protein B0H10DRAFT_2217857 [Mycena sp. CBHHK59/15]|nr:hypothetical protein B0H10DRAFT_2217857 [Mycena sp. CBHHK59/15]
MPALPSNLRRIPGFFDFGLGIAKDAIEDAQERKKNGHQKPPSPSEPPIATGGVATASTPTDSPPASLLSATSFPSSSASSDPSCLSSSLGSTSSASGIPVATTSSLSTARPLPSPSAAILSLDSQSTSVSKNNSAKHQSPSLQSHPGEIAGGVIGGVILLALTAFGVVWFLRRHKKRTAPSAEFLTVYPPETPFARARSFRSADSFDPPPSFSAVEKYNHRMHDTST